MPELIQPEHHKAIKQLAAKGANAPIQRRARLLLLYDAGHSTVEVAKKVGLSVSSVLRWRRLYREQGMGIFPSYEEPPAPASTEPDAEPVAVKEKPKKKKEGKAMKAKKKKKKKGKAKKDKKKKGMKKKGKAKKDKKKKGGKGKKAKRKK